VKLYVKLEAAEDRYFSSNRTVEEGCVSCY